MSLPALYKLADQYRQLEVLAEHDDLPAEVIRDTLEGLGGDLQVKSTNVAKFILGLEMEAKMIEEAAEQMALRAQRRKKRAESIRAYLLLCMQAANLPRVDCPEFTLSVRRNPESIEIEDPAAIPAEFMVQPEPPPARPDKSLIKAAIKDGLSVPGARIRQGERLEIRT